MSKKIVVLLFSVIGLLPSCNTTEPPPPEKTITLTLEDAASIEAWIKLTTTNLQLPAALTLKLNDQIRSTINLVKADTLLYIDSLLPNTTYNFQASSIQSTADGPVSSNQLQVTTMDTTSHDIIWEVETIGGPGSFAFDVAIINENDIWVVGKFFKVGSDTSYNAAHWNGNNWDIVYIPIKAFGGHLSRAPLRAIYYVGNEIWVIGDAGGYARLQNGIWHTEFNDAASASTYKIWGSSTNNIYFIGTNGSITKFNGSSFIKMNSNTDINLTDIYGTPDGSEVWACGRADGQKSIIIKLNANRWERIWERNVFNAENIYNSSSIKTIWLDDRFFAWFTGAAFGVYRQSYKANSVIDHLTFNNQNASHKIRGSSSNNVFMVGDDAMVWHFNGSTWKFYSSLNREEDTLFSLDVKSNVIITVGVNSSTLLTNALIIRGRR